jgi:hypothetical protein
MSLDNVLDLHRDTIATEGGRARHPQRQTGAEAGQGAVVGGSFEGTRSLNGRGGPAAA